MASVNSFAPIGIALAFLLFVGFAFPFVLGFFIPVNEIQLSSMGASVVSLVDNGITLLGISINPFAWLGSTLHEHLVTSVTYLGILPDFINIIASVLIVASIAYGILALIRG